MSVKKTQKITVKEGQEFTATADTADAAAASNTIGVENWKPSDPHPTDRPIATEEELEGKTLAQHLNK